MICCSRNSTACSVSLISDPSFNVQATINISEHNAGAAEAAATLAELFQGQVRVRQVRKPTRNQLAIR